jgi:hypothetical protein
MKRILFIFLFILIPIICLFAQTPDWLWAKLAGGTDNDWGRAISVDGSGNCYVTGGFQGSAAFGSTVLTSSGYPDIFIAKFDAGGNWLWVKQAGGTNFDIGTAISVDSGGNCYLTGEFWGTATFGPIQLTSGGDYDIFAAKLDSNGNWLWARQAGGLSREEDYGISVDSSGNCYVTGYFWDTASFGSTVLTSAGNRDIFVAKLDSNGNWQWARQASGPETDWGNAISADGSGNCRMTGYFTATAAFGTTNLTSSGSEDIFVAKLDSNGNWQWVRQAGGTVDDNGNGISVDGSGNCYVAGCFEGTASFGSTDLTSSGSEDIFLAKLDSNGNWQWARQAGGANPDYGRAVSVDGSGNCHVTGYFTGTASFGATQLTSNGMYDIVTVKLDTGGNGQWAKQAGGTNNDYGWAISADASGNCYLTGNFENMATFDSTILTSGGGSDIFVSKLGNSTSIPADEKQTTPEIPAANSICIYPNPIRSNGEFRVFIKNGESGMFSIHNSKGQLIRTYEVRAGNTTLNWDSKGLLNGIYFCKLTTGKGSITRKFVVVK